MIILDEPYVSQLLKDTIIETKSPVLKNKTSECFGFDKYIRLLKDEEFIELLKKKENCKIYSNSEISLEWIADNLGFTGIPEKIGLFKDKLRFRELIKSLYHDFSYQGVEFGRLEELDIECIRKPFIIKPAVGFFSAGVYKVSNCKEWEKVLKALKQEMKAIKGLFPVKVLNSGKFVIEDCIEGPELAADAYYNSTGKPVVLNILEHIFPSEDDFEDKVYITSKKLIKNYLEATLELLSEINEAVKLQDSGSKNSGLRNFPLHIELRVDRRKRLIPVEVNPIRFAGWCTADIAYYAYGINVHKYFLEELEPDWSKVLKEDESQENENRIYSLLIAKKPDDLETEDIEAFNYEGFISRFEKPLELRKLDYRQYPVFAFLFTETENSNWEEIDRYLKADLKEYIRVKTKNYS